LIIYIEPRDDLLAGVQWRIKGKSTWYYSGEILGNISIGTYTIEFKVVPGWRPEGTITVTVEADKTATGTGFFLNRLRYYLECACSFWMMNSLGLAEFMTNEWGSGDILCSFIQAISPDQATASKQI